MANPNTQDAILARILALRPHGMFAGIVAAAQDLARLMQARRRA